MRIIAKRTLREFWERHPDARRPLLDWYKMVEQADWNAPDQVKSAFASASILRGDRVVFNIKGNTYRLVVHIRTIDVGCISVSSARTPIATLSTPRRCKHVRNYAGDNGSGL